MNCGESLKIMLKPSNKPKKVMIDLGHHHGQGLKEYTKKLGIDRGWRVYCWEPNPHNWKYMPAKGAKNLYSAASDFNGFCKFWLEHNGGAEDGWGSSCVEGFGTKPNPSMPDHMASVQGAPMFGREVKVPCIDFARWLLDHTGPEDEVYIKMDIEGSEYKVLRHMLNQQARQAWIEDYDSRQGDMAKNDSPSPEGDGRIFDRIKWMAVEFHERFMPDETRESTEELKKQVAQLTELEAHW